MSGSEALTDQRLEDLERFRDVDFPMWKKDLEGRFADAFAAGDHIGHRRYHELLIERNAELRRLRQAIIEKTISGLVWSFIVGVGAALWFAVIAYVKSIKGAG